MKKIKIRLEDFELITVSYLGWSPIIIKMDYNLKNSNRFQSKRPKMRFSLVFKRTLKLLIVFSESSRRQIVCTMVKHPLAPFCDFETRHQPKLTHANKKTGVVDWNRFCILEWIELPDFNRFQS